MMYSTQPIHIGIEPTVPDTGLPADRALLGLNAPETVKAVIEGMGRTEEATFSPNGRLLAIAGFTLNRINLFSISITGIGQNKTITLSSCVILHSDALRSPHGIAFIDDEHMIVANRSGGVHVFRIPADAMDHDEVHLLPVRTLRSSLWAKVESPGSLSCYELGDGRFRVLVCNNYLHTITSHTGRMPKKAADGSNKLKRIRNDGVFLEKGLSVPDGIRVSPDRQWLAVSVHARGHLYLYRLDQKLDRKTQPAVILEGVVCPHGLQFSADGRMLYTADSASPYLHMFFRSGDSWTSQPRPDRSISILNKEQFLKGRFNPEEGGLKGIDLLHRENLLVATSEFQPLAFYDLEKLQQIRGLDVEDEIREMSQLRNQAVAVNGW